MGRATGRVQTGALLGAAVLAAGMTFPCSAPSASPAMDGVNLFTPSLGCGPVETQVGTSGLLGRVRADAGAPLARRHDAAKARAQQQRGTLQHAGRRLSAPPARNRAQAPQEAEAEPRAAVLRSFYTCNAAPLPNLTEGTGWRLVGPLRHS